MNTLKWIELDSGLVPPNLEGVGVKVEILREGLPRNPEQLAREHGASA
jgi:hypothetical protein